MRSRYDVVVVGGGHNGLVAAAYLARAGRSVLVLERLPETGGAAVSQAPWPGIDARISRYSYLVSLLPDRIVSELGLRFRTRERRVSSYTPVPGHRPRRPRRRRDAGRLGRVLRALRPRRARGRARRCWSRCARVRTCAARSATTRPGRACSSGRWASCSRPRSTTTSCAGSRSTDALIGTFAGAHDADLRQNRCFLYHVIGNGTGAWNVPVGGMGALAAEIAACAADAGAELVTDAEVIAIEADGRAAEVRTSAAAIACDHVIAGCAPAVLAELAGLPAADPPEGAQLKVNMLLKRLPRLRDAAVDPADAFAGTFHVNETYSQLAAAHAAALAGRVPDPAPCEIYCHSLTDPTILGPELAASGAHTLTLFGLELPARLFEAGLFDAALDSTLRSLDSVLAEPIADCLLRDADGRPCLEAKSPLDLDAELRLPRGNIFHRDLAWPFAERDEDVGTWGTETAIANVHLGGAGARRGGGVSGIPGRNAALAVLG